MFNTCKCGCGTPVGKSGTYVNQAHKQRAYRARKRNQRRALSKYVAGELFELLGDKTATDICRQLDHVAGDKYNYAVDKAMAIIIVELRKLKGEIAHA
jgi:hypothetical protein